MSTNTKLCQAAPLSVLILDFDAAVAVAEFPVQEAAVDGVEEFTVQESDDLADAEFQVHDQVLPTDMLAPNYHSSLILSHIHISS